MSRPLDWDVDGRSWPHRSSSHFIETPGLRWHVQQMGRGPAILLLHGTGASSHSWRGLMPLLATDHSVVAPDLPGHAFTRGRPSGGLTLPGMAAAVDALCNELSIRPRLVIGHSAGVAIALHLASTGWTAPVLGFNAAIAPFEGLAASAFPMLAKLLLLNPLAPRLFAGRARVPGETESFLRRATGSVIDSEGLRCYEILFGNDRHCAGTLEMMANWDLAGLQKRLSGITNPILLVHAKNDRAVSAKAAARIQRRLRSATIIEAPSYGHLFHEEAPDVAADFVRRFESELP